jgi:hypothetical protein
LHYSSIYGLFEGKFEPFIVYVKWSAHNAFVPFKNHVRPQHLTRSVSCLNIFKYLHTIFV